jgi:hypothetical protein
LFLVLAVMAGLHERALWLPLPALAFVTLPLVAIVPTFTREARWLEEVVRESIRDNKCASPGSPTFWTKPARAASSSRWSCPRLCAAGRREATRRHVGVRC